VDNLKNDDMHPYRNYYFEPANKQVEKVGNKLKNSLGPPFYEDSWMSVFKMTKI